MFTTRGPAVSATYGSGLLHQHQLKLKASGVVPDVAHERGYRSIEDKAQMPRHGFRGEQASLVPSLLIPLHSSWGEPAGYQVKPDTPRVVRGKVAKYETRAGERMVIDCHPRVRPVLRDPAVPIVITEGPIKADAIISAGGYALALLGVWGFRGKVGDLDATVNLPELGEIAWQGRQVYVCFDSDVMLKQGVHQACAALGALLSRRGAHVAYAYLPGDGLSKVGVDDWLADGHALGELPHLASPELRQPTEASTPAEPVDTFDDIPEEYGADVLDAVHDFLIAHVVFRSEHQAVAVTLWAAHTHGIEAFASTPRLNIHSPQKQSGKTRLLECLQYLCRNAKLSANMSAAYLFRSVALRRPTLLIDELDTIFRPGDKHHEDLRALINAGHRPDAVVGRIEGEGANMVPKDYPVFCAVATAGIGAPPETVADRGVPIRLRRRAKDERVKPFRQRDTVPQARQLGRRLAAWVSRTLDELAEAEPVMPPGIEDRAADVWEPLLAIADAAGGSWPSDARKAASALVQDRADRADNRDIALLADIRHLLMVGNVFGTRQRASSLDLVSELKNLKESPWQEMNNGFGITMYELAERLRDYDVRPTVVKIAGSSHRGYTAEMFAEAWKRYLPSLPPETPVTL
jgi:Protein of unknown function (DUF3631)/Domain of unknown function (DUF3854)